jgi:toxin ParE1/3/4
MTSTPPPLGPKTLHVTEPARADMDEALDYLAREASLRLALDFADEIGRSLASLADLGHSGVSREWLSPGLRMTVVRRYCIYFRLTDTGTRIIRVLHGARDVRQIVFDDTTGQ